ncbi:MAG: polysaccharide deacetylase family protein [Clostridia bacterium]|nr:polysaccharide deacetylase family protein [Clostridia bacterium]
MAKYLIVNADDYGLCRSANEAVEELFETGKLKSSTVMMTARAAEDAVCFANDHPQYPIGVHLTMTSEWPNYRWKPLTDGKSLVDADGFMWRSSKDVAKNAKLDELEAEIRAQIERAHAMGMHPSHLDNHMGSLYGHQTGRFSLLKMTLRVCGEYGYAFRMFTSTDKRLCPRGVPYPIFRTLVLPSRIWSRRYGVVLPDYLIFPDWTAELKTSYAHYRETILRIWTDIPDGVSETFVHPCVESDEIKSFIGGWRNRVWEYDLLRDPETHRYLADHGVQMISFRELIEMKRGNV